MTTTSIEDLATPPMPHSIAILQRMKAALGLETYELPEGRHALVVSVSPVNAGRAHIEITADQAFFLEKLVPDREAGE